jgi:hypothetical protein
LNHRSWLDSAWVWWVVRLPGVLIGLLLTVWGGWQSWRLVGGKRLAVASALAGWSAAALLVDMGNRTAMPWPDAMRPIPHVVIDREISKVPLFTGAFADDRDGAGYGMFEQWIPRLGHTLSRRSGQDVFLGDGLVVITPTRSISDRYLEGLRRFVDGGGHLLVIDSPDVQGSTTHTLLEAFELSAFFAPSLPQPAPLRVLGCDVEPPMLASKVIAGGEPIA